jgi:CheY-like chemotaxis protein
MMPEMGGIEATQFILQKMEDLKQKPPIIALTADAFLENKEKCIAAGMRDVITKPIQQSQLIQVLSEQLQVISTIHPSENLL